MRTSRLARGAFGLAILGILLAATGLALTNLVGAAPMTGFSLFGLGGLVSLVALVLNLLALFRTRPATGLGGRRLALGGSLLAAAVFLCLATPAFQARDYPPINDITTDPSDPPRFVAAQELEANRGRDMSYPGRIYTEQQREAYPDLAPLELALDKQAAFDAVLAAVEAEGLTVTHRDREKGQIEGYEVTRIFRFVDDVSIRIRPSHTGTRVDLRSKSRDGQGDLGANALRIRRLQRAILEQP